MRYTYPQDTQTLSEKEQLKVMGTCRAWGLGPISFHPDGRVTIYSQAPVDRQVRLAFPNCQILDITPIPLDILEYRFQVTFIPDRDSECEVLRLAAYG